MFLLGIFLHGMRLSASWTELNISSNGREVFCYYVFTNFLRLFLSLFSLWSLIMWMLICSVLSQKSLRLSSPFHYFFILFHSIDSHQSVFQVINLSFCLLFFPCYWFLLVYFHFSYCIIYLYLFSEASSSSLNTFCILLVCASLLFPRSWISFTIITLNSFAGRFPISPSLSYSGGFNLFFCLEHISVLAHFV